MDTALPDAPVPRFPPTGDRSAFQEMAPASAAGRMAPRDVAWERLEPFPVEATRRAAASGMCGIHAREDAGGGPPRLTAAVAVEAPAEAGPSTAACTSIHDVVRTA